MTDLTTQSARADVPPELQGLVPVQLLARLRQDPAVGDPLRELGNALLAGVPARALELVALRVAARRRCPYVWNGHCTIARGRGLTDVDIARVAAGPAALDGRDAAIVRAVDELLDGAPLSAGSVAELAGDALAVIVTVRFYDTIATLMRDAVPDAPPVRGLETPAQAAATLLGNGGDASPPRRGMMVGDRAITDDAFVVIAGPCSVTDAAKTVRVAEAVKAAGATMFRGGAFKPRTDPRSFQGLGERGLAMLLDAKMATGLPIVTELLDVRDLDRVLAVADMVQVGARNMHNTGLLRALGQADRPVLLKRGLAATIDETVKAADYIRGGGNDRVVLCERGIRTFETSYRFTLDLTAVPILKARSGLPVLVDPCHAPGHRELVLQLSKAAAALGADGLIVEVDEDPDAALSDGPQQLRSGDFAAFASEVRRVARGEGREVPAA